MTWFDSLAGIWGSWGFGGKMMHFGDFQRAYVKLSGWAGFNVWESTIGIFEDIWLKIFRGIAGPTWNGMKNVAFW